MVVALRHANAWSCVQALDAGSGTPVNQVGAADHQSLSRGAYPAVEHGRARSHGHRSGLEEDQWNIDVLDEDGVQHKKGCKVLVRSGEVRTDPILKSGSPGRSAGSGIGRRSQVAVRQSWRAGRYSASTEACPVSSPAHWLTTICPSGSNDGRSVKDLATRCVKQPYALSLVYASV